MAVSRIPAHCAAALFLALLALAHSPGGASAQIVICPYFDTTATATAPTGYALVAEDFDEDGILDVAMISNSFISIHRGGGTAGVGDGSLGAPTNYMIQSSSIRGLAAADFNADGILDLASTGNNNVLVRLGGGTGGVGDGTFGAGVTYPTSTGTRDIAVADFDEDGIDDLVVTLEGSFSIAYFRGNGAAGIGDGTFAPAVNYTAGAAPRKVLARDFDGDGILDLAVLTNQAGGGGSPRVSFLRGLGDGDHGNGTFAAPVQYPAGTGLGRGLAAGDFDGDGDLDVAITTSSGAGVQVLLGDGDGVFGAPVGFGPSGDMGAIIALDHLGNGTDDLFYVDIGTGSYLGLRATGAGSFSTINMSVSAGPQPSDLVFGEFLEDGTVDLLSVQAGDATLRRVDSTCAPNPQTVQVVFPNGGEHLGVQESAVISWTKSPGVAAVDLEVSHDGGLNYRTIARHVPGTSLAWNATPPFTGTAHIRVRSSTYRDSADTSDAVFTIGEPCTDLAGTTHASVPGSSALARGDFNEDGILDLAIAGTSTIGIQLGTGAAGVGDGGFAAPTTVPFTGGGTPSIATADFNDDGILDLAATKSAGVHVRLGLGAGGVGNGSFGASVVYPAAGSAFGLTVDDFDEDGIDDLAVTNSSANSVSVLRGNGTGGVGNGTFAAPVHYATGLAPVRVVTGDFDEDGITDLAVVNDHVSSRSVSILLGQGAGDLGDGTFAPRVDYSTGTGNPWGITTGDFDADGITDLAVTSNSTAGLRILPGNGSFGVGDGTFGAAIAIGDAGASLREIEAADIDGDGREDLAVTDLGNDRLLLFLRVPGGTGSGMFAQPQFVDPAATGDAPAGVVIGDFAEDGLPEIVVANQSGASLTRLRTTCPRPLSNALAVTSPNGGETLVPPASSGISWTKGAGVPAVDVELSRDDGANWQPLARRVTGTSLSWNPVLPATFQARVRVVDSALPNDADASDGVFAITPLFTAGSTRSGVTDPDVFVTADFDEDGIEDIAIAQGGSTRLAVMLGNGSGGIGDGTFGPPTTTDPLAGGAAVVTSLDVGDFNSDSILDLVAGIQGFGQVRVLLGQGTGGAGNGTFVAPTPVNLIPAAVDVLVGDFNDDGIDDVASLRATAQELVISLGAGSNGVGTGGFVEAVGYALGVFPRAMASGDFDRNGILDIAIVTQSGPVLVLLGNGSGGRGNGSFGSPLSHTSVPSAYDLVRDDFNEDGVDDLACLSPSGVEILLAQTFAGNWVGQFDHVGYAAALGQAKHTLVSGDFDADGIADLAYTTTAAGTVEVVLGQGTGTQGSGVFGDASIVDSGSRIDPLAVGDFLEDGRADLALGDSLAQGVRLLSGVVAATLDSTVQLISPNGGECFVPGTEEPISWSKGAGVIGVDIEVSRDGGANWHRIASHITQTTLAWTVTPPLAGNVRIRVVDSTFPARNDASDASFAITELFRAAGAAPVLPPGSEPLDIVAADFDEDGIADLATANGGSSSISVLLGQGAAGVGDGTFAGATHYPVFGSASRRIVAADVSGDGILDLLTGAPNGIALFRGAGAGGVGDGSFLYSGPIVKGNAAEAIAVADFDEDGILDLAATSLADANVSILRGGGSNGTNDGTFLPAVNHPLPRRAYDIAVADLDEDGILDLAVADSFGVELLFGNGEAGVGDGTFGPANFYPAYGGARGIVVADLNDDGRVDVATSSRVLDSVGILYGGGSGPDGTETFVSGVRYTVAESPGRLVVGDFDADGIADLAVPHFDVGLSKSSPLTILRGNGSASQGDGTFAAPIELAAGRWSAAIAVGDFLEDGAPDLALPSFPNDSIVVRLGGCPGTDVSLAVTAPLGGETWSRGSTHDIAWTAGGGIIATNVEVSWDGGAIWKPIAARVSGEAAVPWTVPLPTTVKGLVRVSDATMPGRFDVSDAFFTIDDGLVDVPRESAPNLAFLHPTRPNPFGESVRVQLDLVQGGAGTARVYDTAGRLVREIFAGSLAAGRNGLAWDGKAIDGKRAPAGVYFLRVRFPGVDQVRKLVLAD